MHFVAHNSSLRGHHDLQEVDLPAVVVPSLGSVCVRRNARVAAGMLIALGLHVQSHYPPEHSGHAAHSVHVHLAAHSRGWRAHHALHEFDSLAFATRSLESVRVRSKMVDKNMLNGQTGPAY